MVIKGSALFRSLFKLLTRLASSRFLDLVSSTISGSIAQSLLLFPSSSGGSGIVCTIIMLLVVLVGSVGGVYYPYLKGGGKVRDVLTGTLITCCKLCLIVL